jgi:uncharacterized protein YjbJ (UPF0337 family)
MTIAQKIAHRAEAIKGSAKKVSGRIMGSQRLQAEDRVTT